MSNQPIESVTSASYPLDKSVTDISKDTVNLKEWISAENYLGQEVEVTVDGTQMRVTDANADRPFAATDKGSINSEPLIIQQ